MEDLKEVSFVFEIHQLSIDDPRVFRGLEHFTTDVNIKNIDYKNYKKVYSGGLTFKKIQDADKQVIVLLEKIFTKFNIDHPKNYTGRSLSVSDLVRITNESELDEWYFCNRCGWEKVNII